MTFVEAYNACTDRKVVYAMRDGRLQPCSIQYTTAGGPIRPAEGIAEIRFTSDSHEREVNVEDLRPTLD